MQQFCTCGSGRGASGRLASLPHRDPKFGFQWQQLANRTLKTKELMVGAPRFELGTSCAQGRRATRLRYAPTWSTYSF
jgi:hypothetical protein